MKTTSLSAAIISAATLSALPLSGCEEQGQSWTAAALPSRSDRQPAFIKLDDGTMIAVIQREQNIFFYKNASGYAEAGLKADAIVAGASLDLTTANVFREIGHLEALAFVHNDWRRIYDICERQSQLITNSVEPKVVRYWLEMLVEGVPSTNKEGKSTIIKVTPQGLFTEYYPDEVGIPFEVQIDPLTSHDRHGLMPTTHTLRLMSELSQKLVDSHNNDGPNPIVNFTPVYIPLDDGSLLRISQASQRMMDLSPGRITFARTFPGYGVQGLSLQVKGVGLGGERPVSHIYKEISPLEALGYFDGNLEKILEYVERQDRVLLLSVKPDEVRKVFKGK